MRYSKGWGAVLIIILLLLLDQALKIWIKTHMQLHESIEITPWFYLYFTENPGMAFGIEVIGKLFLSVFRIVAVLFIGYYLYKLVKENYKFGFIACISLVFAGAVGNIIDSIFYGVIFDHSFYFPLIETVFPDWVPIWGGQEFVFFRPIFNLADSAICVGVFLLLIFYRHTLSASLSKEEK